ncbi:MAG: UDP-N-acetylglucosamine 1-carboxyvinyltransferase, partial [Candidatus Dormibacterales bacterium]
MTEGTRVTEARDEVLIVEGGDPLRGRLRVSGSKNASLPIMAACLLTRERVRLSNIPDVADTAVMREILESLGCRVEGGVREGLEITAEAEPGSEVSDSLGRRMRASVVLLGALLARTGRARLPRPGGDEIGARRVEQHVRGLRQMGAEVTEEDGHFQARAGRLRGARIILDLPTVTGTENLMMAAVLAKGRTEIFNAAREPHVQDLARFLNCLGAHIRGAGTDEIVVDGVDGLGGGEHRVISDYLEAGTYAMAVAATGGEVRIECSPPHDLTTVLLKLQQAGAEIEIEGEAILVRGPGWGRLRPVDLTTWVHPGFPTDLQAQYMAMMTQAAGRSVISEYIFENRFQHVPELVRLGADVEVSGRTATVTGPARLRGGEATIPDIRSGAALVIAALCAE